jgi:hypothetical protein
MAARGSWKRSGGAGFHRIEHSTARLTARLKCGNRSVPCYTKPGMSAIPAARRSSGGRCVGDESQEHIEDCPVGCRPNVIASKQRRRGPCLGREGIEVIAAAGRSSPGAGPINQPAGRFPGRVAAARSISRSEGDRPIVDWLTCAGHLVPPAPTDCASVDGPATISDWTIANR